MAPGRNEPCPCGSGEKYKYCCLGGPAQGPDRPVTPALGEGEASAPVAPSIGREVAALFLAKQPDPALGQHALGEIAGNAASLVRRYHVHRTWREKRSVEGTIADMIPHLVLDITSLEMSYGARMMGMYCDAIDGLNRRRLHFAALALRAVIELAGAISYHERRISSKLSAGLATQEQLDEVIQLLQTARLGSRFKWGDLLAGTENWDALRAEYAKAKSHAAEPLPDIQQKSSAAFVDEAEKQVRQKWPGRTGLIRLMYAMLSDICHPSWGGELLLVDGPFVDGWHKRRPEVSDDMVSWFFHHLALPVLLNVYTIAEHTLNNLRDLARSPVPGVVSGNGPADEHSS